MTNFNTGRSYKVGDLVMYNYDPKGSKPCDLLAIVMAYDCGQYLIRFLDDGSIMDCVHSELNPVEQS